MTKHSEAKYKLAGNPPNLLALIMMISLASVGAVLYSPAIPKLPHFFLVSADVIQYTMTLYLFGYASGQLLYGPLANRFGRRAALYVGVFIAIVSSFLCGLSAPLHSLTLLLVMRFFMAVGAGVGLTVTVTIINDFFYIEQARRIFPVIAMSFAIIPGLAIFIGGLITYYFNWQECFYFLTLYYIAALFVIRTLPKTLTHKNYDALKLKNLINDYWSLRKNWRLIGFASLVASCTLFIYVFSAQGPIIAKQSLKLNPAEYGGLVLIPSAFIVLGNAVVSYFSKTFTIKQFIHVSIAVMLLSSIALLVVVLTSHLTTFTLFFFVSCAYFANPVCWNCASMMATSKVHDKANASAVLSFINVSGAVFGVLVAGAFVRSPALTLSLLFTLVSVYMVFAAWLLFSKLKLAEA